MACGAGLATALLTRYSSLSALVAAALTPIFFFATDRPSSALAAAFLALLIYWRHGANIQRLLQNTEPKIGQKST